MLLVAGPSPEFLKFIQILCWIILPATAVILFTTIFLHYRKKKRNAAGVEKESEERESLADAFTGLVGYTNGNGEYFSFDHSGIIQQYKDKLLYNHACYTALQEDFSDMEIKYAALATYVQNYFKNHKKGPMENIQKEIPKHLQAEISKLAEDHAAEKKELLAKVEQLERSFGQMEKGNALLQDQVTMGTASDDEKNKIISKWKEEIAILRDKESDQAYLEDLLDEKKAQIIFLQNQLEQRIKNLYQSEHQRLKTVSEMKEVKEKMSSLESDLLMKQEHADKMQVILCEKEELLTEKQQQLNTKMEHVSYMETTLRENKEQNELLNASLAESRNTASALQQQLSDEQSKVQFLTQKLFANKQTIRRLHKEFSAILEDGSEESPVIALRPDYINRENEEKAVQ